jgi:hypothetical protein
MLGHRQVVLLGMALATTAAAKEHICWINHVVLEGAGVRVLFSHKADGHSGSVSRLQFTIDNELVTWLSPDSSPQTERGLFLAMGENAYVHGTPEDVCTIKAAEVSGRLGVIAQASSPGINPPVLSKEFIAGE